MGSYRTVRGSHRSLQVPADQGRRAPHLRWETEGKEFALEALATSDSWDARAGRVFTFPPLSAHKHPWGPFPAEQVLGGGGGIREVGAGTDPVPSWVTCGNRDTERGNHVITFD